MKFNLQGISKNKHMPSTKQSLALLAGVWKKTHTLLFFIFLMGSIISGAYVWQKSLIGEGWSEERKQEYLNTQNKRVIFKENDFKKSLDDIQMRKEKSSSGYQPIKDIFIPYK